MLETLNRRVVRNFNIKKNEIIGKIKVTGDLKKEGSLAEDLKEERLTLKAELAKVVRRETSSWRQKATVNWTKEEDCNSAFFHHWVNGRSKNSIDSLETLC